MNYLCLILLIFIIHINAPAQDSTRSDAFKENNPQNKYPLIKPKYRSYPLMTGYLLMKEANEGDPFAQHELGLRYLLGNGFSPDTTKAVQLIKRAVDTKIPAAEYNYGILQYNNIGVAWNPFEAFQYIESAANNDMPDAQFVYGILLTDNLIVPRNYSEAYMWIKKAADGGNEPAKEVLGEFQKLGINFEQNSDEKPGKNSSVVDTASVYAATIIQSEWELDFFEFKSDSTESQNEQDEKLLKEITAKNKQALSNILGIQEAEIVKLSDTSSTGLIKYASDKGSPEALMLEGKLNETGFDRPSNLILALEKYIIAYRLGASKPAAYIFKLTQQDDLFKQLKVGVDNKNPNAMYVWAGLTALGFDYQLTERQALGLLQQASEMNHVNAIIETGLCYFNGNMVEQNKPLAFKYWQRASGLGSLEAKVRLAFAKILQQNDSTDIIAEVKVLINASENGSVLGQAALAYCYEQGIGLKQNKGKAAKLYRNASNRGSRIAFNSLKRMYDEIRPKDERFVIFE